MSTDEGDETVGYGKPPSHTRFKKGQSGNPRGKPKGVKNLSTVVVKSLAERVTINEGGQRRKITKLEAATKQLANKAAQGDPRATQFILQLLQMLENRPPAPPPRDVLSDADNEVMQQILARMGTQAKGD